MKLAAITNVKSICYRWFIEDKMLSRLTRFSFKQIFNVVINVFDVFTFICKNTRLSAMILEKQKNTDTKVPQWIIKQMINGLCHIHIWLLRLWFIRLWFAQPLRMRYMNIYKYILYNIEGPKISRSNENHPQIWK